MFQEYDPGVTDGLNVTVASSISSLNVTTITVFLSTPFALTAGVTGVITIDQDHNAVKSAVVLKVENGAARFVATVKP